MSSNNSVTRLLALSVIASQGSTPLKNKTQTLDKPNPSEFETATVWAGPSSPPLRIFSSQHPANVSLRLFNTLEPSFTTPLFKSFDAVGSQAHAGDAS